MLSRALVAILLATVMAPGVVRLALPSPHAISRATTDDALSQVFVALNRVRADLRVNGHSLSSCATPCSSNTPARMRYRSIGLLR